MRGKALAVYILTGEGARPQTEKAAAERRDAAAAAKRAKRELAAPRPPREGSAMHAAVTILKTARGPLTPQEIYDRAKAKGLAGGLKGKTPVATLAAQMATANKKGIHVERTAPGRYQLRKS